MNNIKTNVDDYEIIQTNKDGTKTVFELAEVIDLGGRTRIKFSSNKIYDASSSELSTAETTQFKIILNYLASGAKQDNYRYDYSRLGETWSNPRIFRMPVDSSGTIKEIYVAVMGGGMGVAGSGSNVFIVNMEDSGSIFLVSNWRRSIILFLIFLNFAFFTSLLFSFKMYFSFSLRYLPNCFKTEFLRFTFKLNSFVYIEA